MLTPQRSDPRLGLPFIGKIIGPLPAHQERQMREFARKVTMDTYAGRQLLSGRTQGIATR
jgi:hypothetical protein